MTHEMSAAWRKMVGMALLWFALAALVYLPGSTEGARAGAIAAIGFASFCAGSALFAEGMERDILERLRRQQARS